MSTYNAIMQIQVDASDANKKLTEVDRNLTSIRSTSSETSSSLKRMEGTFARIEKTMRSVERTMKGVHRIMKYMAQANAATSNSFIGLGKSVADINSKFNKFSSNISNISSKYATLKKQNKNLSDQINKLKQDMKALGSATGGAGTKTKETGGAFERLTKVLKENSYWVGSLVGGFLSLISIDLAGHFVRITDQLTLMKNRLGTVNPEVVKLRENFNTVVQIAMETRSNLAAVANLYSRIGRNSQRLQKDQEALARVVRTINQGFQLSGATAEEARNAIVQLSQAFASGRLQGDELRSVLELAPEAAKGLAKAIGITTGTMRRFAAEGMITTEVMVAAFEKASAETQAKFDNIKATISQAMENVRTAIYAGIEGAEEFGNANQLIANKIMSLANMIKNAKDQFSFIGKIVENVALNFEKFAAGIVAVVGVLGGMIIVSSLTALFSSFGAVIGLSAGAVAGLVTILGLLAYRLIDLNLEIKTTAEQLRPLDEVIKELSDSTKTGMDRLNGYREELANTKLASDELEVQLGVINRKINELSQSVINARGTWREYADDLLGFIQEYKIFGLDLILPGSDKQELAVLTERAAKLEKLQMDMADRTSKLREQEKKAMEEVKKGAKEIDPQELLLKEVYAKQAAFARQMELVGEALSNEFIQGFTNPFDSGLGGIQSALTRFTENVASKTASLFKSKLPEGIPLFDPKVLVKQASSFNQAIEEGLRSGKRVSLFGMPDENGIRQLTQEYKDVITSILGDPSTQAAFKEQDTLGKIMQAEMDSILREQLIDLEKAINQYIIQQNQKIKTEERSLKAQREQLELTEFSAKAEMDGLKKNTPLLKVQESIIEEEYRIRLLNYEQKLKDLNITGQTKNALMEELALQKDLAISLEKVNQEKKLYLELQGKQRDLVSATERVADLQLELDHLIKGTNELEKQKSLNETIIAREKVILDQRREREDLTDEQYRQELAILETKKSLLDLETDITEEIKKQNELRKTEDELARARLLDQAKTQAQQMKGQLSLFQQLGIGLGLVKDPTKDFVDRQEAFIDATIASGKKVSDLYMGRGGTGLQINPAVQRDMDETAMNIIKNRMELFEEKSKTTPLNNNLATRLLGQSKFAPQEMEYALQRKKGGMLSGPSHASGGIKGMLYGQAIELEGGEYVINKDAVAKYGIPMFNALNTMRFAPGGVLPGTELTPQEAMRIANNLRTAGKLKEAKKFSDAVAEDYARRGVPTFRADGTVIGDPKKMLQKGDTTKAVEEVTEGFVKMAPAIEEVTKESKKVEKEFTKTNEAIGYAGSSWKEIETLSQKEIDAIESVTSRRMTAEEEAAYAIKKVTETYRESARDWKEAYAEAEMRMGPQTGLLGDGMMGQTAAGIGAVFADALGQSGAFKGFLEDIVMLTTNPVAGVTQILSKSLLQNERFQQALQRFLDIFYVLFDEVAEGLAILFEAIVDVLAPLKPLMQMIGGALRDIMRAFTQIIQPLAMLIESLQPILIYLSGFLQIIVGIFSSIVGGIASIFTNLFTNVLSVFGIDTQGYKSLNLLRQEKDILTEINSTIGDLSNSLGDIKDVIFEIMNSALNLASPSLKLELAAQKYNELFLAATSITATDENIDEFQNFAKTYLQQAQDVLKSSVAYQQIYARVIGDLEGIQNTLGADIGYEFTTKMKEAIFNLRLAGSSIADELVKATDAYQDGTLSFTDLATYVNFKLSQVEKDINLKDMADFGSLGDFTEVSQAYEDYLSDQFGRFEQAMGNAISNSSFEQDLAFLFGITPEGGVAAGATTKFVDIGGTTYEIPVGVTESEAFIATASGRSLSRQPELGDIQQAPDITQDRVTGVEPPSLGEGIDLAKILEELLSGIWDALVKAIENIIGTFAEFLDAIFGWISDLGITAKDFLENLFSQLFEGTRTALQAIGDFFTEVLDLDQLPDALGALGKFFESIINLNSLPDAFGALGEFFNEIISGSGISDALTALGEFFNEIFGFESGLTATKVLEELFDALFSGTRTAAEAIGDFFGEILGTGSRSPFQALGDFFDQILGTGSRSVSQALSDFFTKTISGTAQDVSSALSDFFNRIVSGSALGISDFIDEFFQKMFSGSGDVEYVLDSLFQQASSLIESILMFKNPFYPAIGGKYLIEFAEGGYLKGPSHSEGGVKASVGGKGLVELEGGEYIINKRTVDALGTDFLGSVNSLRSKNDLVKQLRITRGVFGNAFANGGSIPKFQGGTSISDNAKERMNSDIKNYVDDTAKWGDMKSIDVSDLYNFDTSSIVDALSFVGFRGSGFTKKENRNSNAPSGKRDPMRLIEPQAWIPEMTLFDVGVFTKGWFKDLIGDHELALRFDFPSGGVSGNIPGIGSFAKGGVIPTFENGGVTDVGPTSLGGKMPLSRMPAFNNQGGLNETRLKDDLKYNFEVPFDNITNSALKSIGAPSSVTNAFDGFTGKGTGVGKILESFFSGFGFLGGRVKDLAKFSPLGGMSGSGKDVKENFSMLETLVLGLMLWYLFSGFTGLNQGRLWESTGAMGLYTLLLAPAFGTNFSDPNSGNPAGNSILDSIEQSYLFQGIEDGLFGALGFNETISKLLTTLLLVYGTYTAYQGASGASTRKTFNPFANPAVTKGTKRSGAIFDFLPPSPSYGSGGFVSGMAYGPSHASGMLGLTEDGSPFLFEGGEYIMSREAVSNIGVSTLDQMNFGKGGAIANEMFDISGGSTKYGQFILIADYVDLGNITAGVANNYFDHKYLDRMVAGSFKSDYESFGNGGSLRSFASGEAVGPSHQSGMLGMTPDGSPFLFEGGEYIINRKSAERIGMDGLNALNSMGSGGPIREFANSGYTDYTESDLISDAFRNMFKKSTYQQRTGSRWYNPFSWFSGKKGGRFFTGSQSRSKGGGSSGLYHGLGIIATLASLFSGSDDNPDTPQDERIPGFSSLGNFVFSLGKNREFLDKDIGTQAASLFASYYLYDLIFSKGNWGTGKMFGAGGSLPEFKRSNWVSESGMSVLRADWIRDVFGKRKIASDNARSSAAFASNMLGILGLAGSGVAGGLSLAYLNEFLGGGEEDPRTGKSNKGNFGALLGSLLLGGLSASLWKWSDPFGGRSYGSGGGIPEFATSGEIARKKAFERGMFEISAGRDVSRSRAFRTDGGMNSSGSGMDLGGYLLALGVLGALYNNRKFLNPSKKGGVNTGGSSLFSFKNNRSKDFLKNPGALFVFSLLGSAYWGANSGAELYRRQFMSSEEKPVLPLLSMMGSGFGKTFLALGGASSLLYNMSLMGMLGEGGGIPEFGRGSFPFLGKKSNVAPEAALMIASMFGAGALNYYSGREGVRGTREGLKIQNYGQLLGSIGLLAGGYLGSKKQPDSAFGPLMMLFATAFAYDSLSKLGYLGEDTSGILPQYSEFGSGGSLPEFRRGDILPQHFLGLSGRFAGSPKNTPKFSKDDPYVKFARNSLKDQPNPIGLVGAGSSLALRYIIGPALLAALAVKMLNPDNNKKLLKTNEEKLFAAVLGAETALYPTKGKQLGPFPRAFALGYGAYQLSSVPMLLEVLGDSNQNRALRAFAALSLYPAIAGGYEFGKMGVTGKFEWPELVKEYTDLGMPESTRPNDGFFGTTKKVGQGLFYFTKGMASYLGPFIIASALERQKKEREEKKKFRGYASGGILQAGGLAKGPSHQSGMVGYAKGGMPFLFEGGEYILSKDATNSVGIDYLDMLNSMGSGGVIPSFETSGPIPESLKLYGRRDLFGMRTISTTADDGTAQEVNVMNYDDFAEAELYGGSTNDLLYGISEILFSIYDSQGLGMGSFIPTLEEATELEKQTLRALGVLVEDDKGIEQMLVPGGLLTRTQLDLISPAAKLQFADAVAIGVAMGMGGSLARIALNQEEINELTQEGRELYFAERKLDPRADVDFEKKFQVGGIGYYKEQGLLPEGLDKASPSFIMGFSSMAVDQLTMAIATGFALVMAAQIYEQEKAAANDPNAVDPQGAMQGAIIGAGIGSAFGPGGMMFGQMLGAELGGKPDKYFKDYRGEDLVEPFEGTIEEFEKIADGDFEIDYENVSQKLSDSLSNFGEYLSGTMFAGAGTGVRKFVDEFSKGMENFANDLWDGIFGEDGFLGKVLKFDYGTLISKSITEAAKFLTNMFFGEPGGLFPALRKFFLEGGWANVVATLPQMLLEASTGLLKVVFQWGPGGMFYDAISSLGEIIASILPPSIAEAVDGILTAIMRIPNFLIEKFIEFYEFFAGVFGIDVPGFELQALKNPFYGNLGGPEYIIDISIGDTKESGLGGLVSYAKGGELVSQGGIAVGPSHSSGMLGLTRDGSPFVFEGGEYIISKRSTEAIGSNELDRINSTGSIMETSQNPNPNFDLLNLYNPLGQFGIGPSNYKIDVTPAIDLSKMSMNQNIFEKGGPTKQMKGVDDNAPTGVGFDVLGDIFDHEISYDFFNVDNTFGYFETAYKWVKKQTRERIWDVWHWVWKTVTKWVQESFQVWKQVGPDNLRMGIDGNLLNFWDSNIDFNFGGLLDWLGVSDPSISRMKNGGFVSGLPHYLGGVLAELEGGEYVINRNSAREIGGDFLGEMNGTTGSGFAGSLVSSSMATNNLLSRLIQVVEEKEMSVTVLDESGNEKSDSSLMISQNREREYRGARMLA